MYPEAGTSVLLYYFICQFFFGLCVRCLFLLFFYRLFLFLLFFCRLFLFLLLTSAHVGDKTRRSLELQNLIIYTLLYLDLLRQLYQRPLDLLLGYDLRLVEPA